MAKHIAIHRVLQAVANTKVTESLARPRARPNMDMRLVSAQIRLVSSSDQTILRAKGG